MTKRRGNGDGAIYRRASDNLWVGSLTLPFAGGKRRRKVVYGKTRADVVKKLRDVQTKIDRGSALPDERLTTKDFLDRWVKDVLPGTIKDSTLAQYEDVLNRYVIPFVGRTRLARLGPQDVQQMMRGLEDRGLSPRTRRQARAILRRALNHAERWELVTRNAAALVECPKIGGSEIDDALTLNEATCLLETLRGDRNEALITLGLMTGLRKGELLALKWENVDLDANELSVVGTLKRGKGVGLYIDTPKTARATRTIPIPLRCSRALTAHRKRQLEQRLALGPAWHENGLVFASPIGTPIDPRNLTRKYHSITEAAGLGRRRFHALRHSAATLMLENGVPLEVISRTLGHAGLAITADVYAKVSRGLQRQAADAMEAALRSG